MDIKVSLGRPRKNRKRDPQVDLKNLGKLSRHDMVMSCNNSKRSYPSKANPTKNPSHRRGVEADLESLQRMLKLKTCVQGKGE